jgi:hypothetical protein
MKKLKSISRLKKDADHAFSHWIRKRDAKCYTCITGRAEQNGHYVSRAYLALRYSEKNCHAQCVSCNVFRNGNLTVYALKLIEEYGTEILKEFENTKRNHISNPRKFYEEIISKYA